MISIQTYLAQARKQMAHTGLVVIGNEAADLDSMASSITYGYLRSLQGRQKIVLPVMPIPRADFTLRTEAVYVFKEANIALDEVVFFDEVNFDALMDRAELALVDHNKPGIRLEKYGHRVVSILDHHKDEGLYTSATPRRIETVGSTTSLVAMEFNAAGVEITGDVAVLIAGTILLDTVNLDDAAGRVTAVDKEIASRVLPLCPRSRQEFFDSVRKEKFNVDGLSTYDLLRKDYKQWQLGKMEVGIGSVSLPVAEWSKRDNELASGFSLFAEEKMLDLLLSMNSYLNPGYNRDLVIFSRSKDILDSVVTSLQKNGLALTPLACLEQKQSGPGWIAFYRQGNTRVSRKKMQPLLAALWDHYL